MPETRDTYFADKSSWELEQELVTQRGGSPSWYRAVEEELEARGYDLTNIRRTVGANVH